MFDLAGQAAAIVVELKRQEIIKTVAYIDRDDQSMRHPVTFPAAFVVLEKLTPTTTNRQTIISDIVWSVVIRSKQLEGVDGCLPIIDLVIDSLVGFKPGADVHAMRLNGVEYFDNHEESVAYIVRFDTRAAGESTNKPCGQ